MFRRRRADTGEPGEGPDAAETGPGEWEASPGDASPALAGPAGPWDAGQDVPDQERIDFGSLLVPTGIAIALPDGYAAFIHPRSGLAARHGVTLVNAPGTVDAGYRGEIRVTLLNTDGHHAVSFQRGDRIAQLVIQQVAQVVLQEVESLPGSARAEGGFGSTGGHAAGQPLMGEREPRASEGTDTDQPRDRQARSE